MKKKYQAPSKEFFRMPNNIFDLRLTPIQFTIYAMGKVNMKKDTQKAIGFFELAAAQGKHHQAEYENYRGIDMQ